MKHLLSLSSHLHGLVVAFMAPSQPVFVELEVGTGRVKTVLHHPAITGLDLYTTQ